METQTKTGIEDINVVDFFCGCGGFSKGFENVGFNVIAGFDFNKDAISSFNANHKAKGIFKDVTKLTNEELDQIIGEKKVDVLIGGFPCQGFSYLGKRNKRDPRNLLYRELLRFISHLQPQYIILENVRGLLTMKDSNGELILFTVLRELIERGYLVGYKLLCTSDYGVPQNRNRVIIFAQRTSFFDLPKQEKASVMDAIGDLNEQGSSLNAHLVTLHTEDIKNKISLLKEGERLSENFHSSRFRLFGDKPSRTITRGDHIHPIFNRTLTPREAARLQSFADDFTFIGGKESMRLQIGNAVPPIFAQLIATNLAKEIRENHTLAQT